MADVTYVIEIRDGGGGGNGGNGVTKISPNASPGVSPTQSGDSGSSSGIKLGKMAETAVRQIGNRVISTYINRVSLRTGQATLQQRLSYQKGAITRAAGIGAAILGGAAAGNPIAVAAGIGSAVSWGVDIAVAQDQINLQQAVEGIGISEANIRAGVSGDRNGRKTY